MRTRRELEQELLDIQSNIKRLKDIQRKRIGRAVDAAKQKGYNEGAFLAISDIVDMRPIMPITHEVVTKSGKRKRQSITARSIGSLSEGALLDYLEQARREQGKATRTLSTGLSSIRAVNNALQDIFLTAQDVKWMPKTYAEFERWAVTNPNKFNNLFSMRGVFDKLPVELRPVLHELLDKHKIDYDLDTLVETVGQADSSEEAVYALLDLLYNGDAANTQDEISRLEAYLRGLADQQETDTDDEPFWPSRR